MSDAKIASDVAAALRRIESRVLSERELLVTLQNVARSSCISEVDRERLVSALEAALRSQFPKSANRLFGPKDAEAREFLIELLGPAGALAREGNMVGSGVKTGGYQFDGSRYINVYVSYKNSSGLGVSLDFNQDTVDTTPYLVPIDYHVEGGRRTTDAERHWTIAEGTVRKRSLSAPTRRD
jgi:hypothetical protein